MLFWRYLRLDMQQTLLIYCEIKENMSEQKAITKEQIAQWKQARIKECGEKINAILSEYECALVAVPRLDNGVIVADIQLVSK
jgi:hypothetical protein